MSEEPELRRTLFRNYRRGDVELAIARATIARERLQVELDATKVRLKERQTDIDDLQAQLDSHRRRETDLLAALDEVRARRDALEREARSRADEILADAEQRAASMRTDGLRQVGELQRQIEQLFSLRTALTAALQGTLGDVSAALERLISAPAQAVEPLSGPKPPPQAAPPGGPEAPEEQPHGLEPHPPPRERLDETLARFSSDPDR
jgi:chromosome segregation ATPase